MKYIYEYLNSWNIWISGYMEYMCISEFMKYNRYQDTWNIYGYLDS